jgi:hypothetical protein
MEVWMMIAFFREGGRLKRGNRGKHLVVSCIYLPVSERGYSILGTTEGDGLSLEQIFSRKLCGSQN